MPKNMIDLFAGIGGIRKGFELTGNYTNVLSAEIDPYACETYEHNFGDNPKNDVTSEDFKQHCENIEYDILLGGFPCQAFSRAGKQEGFLNATKGTLFFDVADIIRRTQPEGFLLENVDNLYSHDKGNTFTTIINVLEKELDYKIVGVSYDEDKLTYSRTNFVRNSRFFGIPQNRPRIYLMGFSRTLYPQVDMILKDASLPTQRDSVPIYKNLDALLEFGALPEYYIASGALQSMKNHRNRHEGKGNGFGYIVVNDPNDPSEYSNAVLATGGSGKERNLIYDFQTNLGGMVVKGKKSPLNNEGIRYMTPREWGKLQGFVNYGFINPTTHVDEFSFPPTISKTQQYKMFGNAVTIPTIQTMAEYMNECFTKLEKPTS